MGKQGECEQDIESEQEAKVVIWVGFRLIGIKTELPQWSQENGMDFLFSNISLF